MIQTFADGPTTLNGQHNGFTGGRASVANRGHGMRVQDLMLCIVAYTNDCHYNLFRFVIEGNIFVSIGTSTLNSRRK